MPTSVGIHLGSQTSRHIHTRFRKTTASLCSQQFRCQRCSFYQIIQNITSMIWIKTPSSKNLTLGSNSFFSGFLRYSSSDICPTCHSGIELNSPLCPVAAPLKTSSTFFLVLHLLFLPLAVPVMPPSCCGCLSQYTHHHLVTFLLTFFR